MHRILACRKPKSNASHLVLQLSKTKSKCFTPCHVGNQELMLLTSPLNCQKPKANIPSVTSEMMHSLLVGHDVHRMCTTLQENQGRCNDASQFRSLFNFDLPQKNCTLASTNDAPSMRNEQQKMVCRIQSIAAVVEHCNASLHLRCLFGGGLAQAACTSSWDLKAHRLQNGYVSLRIR